VWYNYKMEGGMYEVVFVGIVFIFSVSLSHVVFNFI
jgi:hypothetical protein